VGGCRLATILVDLVNAGPHTQQHWEDCFPRQDVGFPEFFLENPSRVIAAVKQTAVFKGMVV